MGLVSRMRQTLFGRAHDAQATGEDAHVERTTPSESPSLESTPDPRLQGLDASTTRAFDSLGVKPVDPRVAGSWADDWPQGPPDDADPPPPPDDAAARPTPGDGGVGPGAGGGPLGPPDGLGGDPAPGQEPAPGVVPEFGAASEFGDTGFGNDGALDPPDPGLVDPVGPEDLEGF